MPRCYIHATVYIIIRLCDHLLFLQSDTLLVLLAGPSLRLMYQNPSSSCRASPGGHGYYEAGCRHSPDDATFRVRIGALRFGLNGL